MPLQERKKDGNETEKRSSRTHNHVQSICFTNTHTAHTIRYEPSKSVFFSTEIDTQGKNEFHLLFYLIELFHAIPTL